MISITIMSTTYICRKFALFFFVGSSLFGLEFLNVFMMIFHGISSQVHGQCPIGYIFVACLPCLLTCL